MLLHHTLTNLKLPNPRPWCSHCQDLFAPSCVSLELIPGQETCRFPASVWTPLFQTLLHSLTIELSPACHHVSTGNSFPQGTLALLSTWHTPSFPLSYSSHPLNTWEIFHLFPISVSTSILALYIFNLQYTNTDLCIWNLVGQLLVFPSGFIIFRRTVIFTLFSIISCSLCILEKNWIDQCIQSIARTRSISAMTKKFQLEWHPWWLAWLLKCWRHGESVHI